MILRDCSVENFGSYERLEVDFSNTGLVLVYGPTGSGKSTLIDVAYWILFGVTAKAGNADEVRSWQRPDEVTVGTLVVELVNGSLITITRKRGKANQNDLFWQEGTDSGDAIRGKDLQDTQKRIEQRIGVNANVYMAASFYSEFSPSGSFFLARAKDRRDLFDSIASLGFPRSLADACADARKMAKSELQRFLLSQSASGQSIERLKGAVRSSTINAGSWRESHIKKTKEIKDKAKNFEKDKEEKLKSIFESVRAFETDITERVQDAKVEREDLTTKRVDRESLKLQIKALQEGTACKSCGGPDKTVQLKIERLKEALAEAKAIDVRISSLIDLDFELKKRKNPHLAAYEIEKNRANHYDEILAEHEKQVNPYEAQVEQLKEDLVREEATRDSLCVSVSAADIRQYALLELQDLAIELRGELLKKTVAEIEASTNAYLEKYFDSEFRVSFTVEADAIDVEVQKDGYACSYKQLSKGQRGLLRICFSVATMAAASNSAGLHFNALLFDEALDGLDTNLKLKAFDLFQELSLKHSTVMLVDHSPDFQNLFERKVKVIMTEGISDITEEG